VASTLIKVSLIGSQLVLQVGGSPEKGPIQQLSPNATDQSLNKWMSHRDVWQRFDLFDFQYSQSGFPAVILKYRIAGVSDCG